MPLHVMHQREVMPGCVTACEGSVRYPNHQGVNYLGYMWELHCFVRDIQYMYTYK